MALQWAGETGTAQSLLFRGYTPGIVSALLVVFPYCLYTYIRLFGAGIVTWSSIWSSLPLGLAAVVAIFLMGHLLGRKLFPPAKRSGSF